LSGLYVIVFFFQAEDGIRDKLVTGVQTCALPILARFGVEHLDAPLAAHGRRLIVADPGETTDDLVRDMIEVLTSMCARLYGRRRSEERRVGKECRARGGAAGRKRGGESGLERGDV